MQITRPTSQLLPRLVPDTEWDGSLDTLECFKGFTGFYCEACGHQRLLRSGKPIECSNCDGPGLGPNLYCSGCGEEVSGLHKCGHCSNTGHLFCGVAYGEESSTRKLICPACVLLYPKVVGMLRGSCL